MIAYPDYLRLLPKTELHCHFIATMRPEMIVELADRNGVTLPSRDIEAYRGADNLVDFLKLFEVARAVLVKPEDFAEVAYAGVADAVRDGNLRYREYFINPQDYESVIGYADLMDAVVDGLRRAEAEYGVGFRVIAAINRMLSPEAAAGLVRTMTANPRPEVVGIGQDYLTPAGDEAPELWTDAYRLAEENGLRRTAHVGETMSAPPGNVLTALDQLHCDRIDHGYRAADDPEVLARVVASQVPLTCTPISTAVLSGWQPAPGHRIAALISAGVNVTLSTDDAVFFGTDIGREYVEGLARMGFGPETAKRVSLAGVRAAWCDDEQKARLLAEFHAQHVALDAVLDPA